MAAVVTSVARDCDSDGDGGAAPGTPPRSDVLVPGVLTPHLRLLLRREVVRDAEVRAQLLGALALDLVGLRESFGANISPLSSCRSPQAALKFSYRSDRVTRD